MERRLSLSPPFASAGRHALCPRDSPRREGRLSPGLLPLSVANPQRSAPSERRFDAPPRTVRSAASLATTSFSGARLPLLHRLFHPGRVVLGVAQQTGVRTLFRAKLLGHV